MMNFAEGLFRKGEAMRSHRLGLFALLLLSIGLAGCGKGDSSDIGTGSQGQPLLWDTGDYQNLFVTLSGKSQEQVNEKLGEMAELFFMSSNKIYFEDNNGAYFKDVINNDVRSEGMSYAMMIALQLDGIPLPSGGTFDGKDKFDKLWNWAKSNMDVNAPHGAASQRNAFIVIERIHLARQADRE